MERSQELIASGGYGGASSNSSAFAHCARSSIPNDERISARADPGTSGEAPTNSGQKSLVIQFRPNEAGVLTAEILKTDDTQNTEPSTVPFVHSDTSPVAQITCQRLATLTIQLEGNTEVVLQGNSSILELFIDQSSTPLWDQGLRAFPPEIRNKIFKEMLCNSWKGRTPNLIKALRSSRKDQDLYYDAMNVFYKTNCYMLNHNNEWSFGDMPGSVLQNIRVLGFDIGYSGLKCNWKKLVSSMLSFRVYQNLNFHTLYLTDTTPADSANFTDIHRDHRDQKVGRLLAGFVVFPLPNSNCGRKRKGLKHVVLSTQLEFPLVYPLVERISSRVGRRPRLAEVSSTLNTMWFWDVVNREELKAPENMDLFRV